MSSPAYHEYTAIILGGTGRLGSHLVRSFLLSPLCSRLVSIGRPGHADRLNNFIAAEMGSAGAKSKLKAIDVAEDLSDLPAAMREHGTGTELAVSALGARGGRYGLASPADLLRLDVDKNLSFAETAAQDLGASHITLMSHVGANNAKWIKNENAEDEATPRNFKDAKGLLEGLTSSWAVALVSGWEDTSSMRKRRSPSTLAVPTPTTVEQPRTAKSDAGFAIDIAIQ
ncbi:hypothetical protein FOZ63_002866, partial [Perkinsus olseni]